MRPAGRAAFVLLALTGCTVGPNYHRPAIETPSEFRFSDREAAGVADIGWWKQFNDPVMDRLIHEALAGNKDVKIAAARIEEFAGRYRTARAQLIPQVGADANASRQRVTQSPLPAAIPPTINPTYNQFEAVLSVSWELDIWGKLRRLSQAARADFLGSEDARRATILSLVGSVASSYVNLRSLDRQLEIATATAATRGESVKLFELRFGGGVVSEIALAQAKSDYEAALASIPQLNIQIAEQESALSLLLGRNPGPIERGLPLMDFGAPAVPAGLPSELLERRPDLQQAEQALIAANARMGAARAMYFPTISLTGLLGSVSSELSNLFTGPARVWAFAGDVSAPVFTGGAIAGEVQVATALRKQALLQYEQAIQTSFKEVEDSLISVQKSREQAAAQGRQVDSLRTYDRLARLRYDNGYTSYLEVLDAERSLFNAQLSYTQTRGLVLNSVIALYLAMGGGWVEAAATDSQ